MQTGLDDNNDCFSLAVHCGLWFPLLWMCSFFSLHYDFGKLYFWHFFFITFAFDTNCADCQVNYSSQLHLVVSNVFPFFGQSGQVLLRDLVMEINLLWQKDQQNRVDEITARKQKILSSKSGKPKEKMPPMVSLRRSRVAIHLQTSLMHCLLMIDVKFVITWL